MPFPMAGELDRFLGQSLRAAPRDVGLLAAYPLRPSSHGQRRPPGLIAPGLAERLQTAGGGNAPLAVYIHWPFCRSKCPYCDFNSHVRDRIDMARWQRALLADLTRQAATAPDRIVTSVFFGGGTPSLMDPEIAATVIARIRELWAVDPDLEITLEANPNSAEAERFAAFAQAGVTRLSLGIQSLDPAAL